MISMKQHQEHLKISTAFQTFLRANKYYSSSDLEEVIQQVRTYFRFSWSNKKQKYFNVPCAFDIESSSFYNDAGEKAAVMYVWTFGIFGLVIYGRTWSEFTMLIDRLSEVLDLSTEKRLIIYVHNLGFDFQFFRKHFEYEKVFAVKARTPIYALTKNGVEFRCSYLLSGYSLEKLSDQLTKYHVHKLVGDLDYAKIRHNKTPLTDSEIRYCINDVKVIMAYIMEKIEQDGGIAKIPLTKTGYVRNYCRTRCFYDEGISRKDSLKRIRYKELIDNLTMDPEEYLQLKRAFQGGFTHANAFFTDRIIDNVASYDFTSSYPAVMIAEKFPMSKGEKIVIHSEEELEKNLRLYCCVFDIQFYDLVATQTQENYISESRCWHKTRPIQTNNGRVVRAREICITLTEQDYLIIKKYYRWSKKKIANFRRYKKDYLPTDFVKSILQLYANKTMLKGVKGKEVEYLQSKEMVNACYGMMVTDPVREQHLYTDHWLLDDEIEKLDVSKEIEKYNRNQGRFLFYPWGIWVTAYARRNLFTGITQFGPDYIYSDTDSIKVRNADRHAAYINKYNLAITDQLKRALRAHGIPEDSTEPETIKGVKKPLGVWDYEGTYTRFKTLGAKRYMVEDGSGVNITVAGLNKNTSVPYLCYEWYYDIVNERYVNDPFDKFTDDLQVSGSCSGKMTHTYIDDEMRGTITDYLGNSTEYHELSGIHLEQAGYSLKLSDQYIAYLTELKR